MQTMTADAPRVRPVPLLEVRGIHKAFRGVVALDEVAFDVLPGEVHALVGENGAGKSTLLSIMNGLQAADAGEIRLSGEPVRLRSPAVARANRLAMVHQELVLCPNMTVAENVFVGAEPLTAFGRIDRRRMEQDTRALLERIGVDLDPAAPVAALSLSQRQIVEICKALAARPRVLVFDEPTASLVEAQVESLLAIIRRLREEGLGIVYVSHRLREVLSIADRVTVLRDGRIIDTLPVAEADEARLIRLMVGRDLVDQFPAPRIRVDGPPLLEVDKLGVDGAFADVSFSIRGGEILGIAGLMGCAREVVVRSLFGLDPADRGEIRVRGQRQRIASPRQAIAAGIGYMPADRKKEGLVLEMAVQDNLVLPVLPRVARSGLLSRRRRRTLVDDMIGRLQIRLGDPATEVANLSGGNQQKVVIGKWLAREGDILLVEEPTRGVDVGAKPQIWAALDDLAARGKAILLVSSELPELMGVCDRIVVMSCGRVTGCFARPDFSAEEIARCAVAVPPSLGTAVQ